MISILETFISLAFLTFIACWLSIIFTNPTEQQLKFITNVILVITIFLFICIIVLTTALGFK